MTMAMVAASTRGWCEHRVAQSLEKNTCVPYKVNIPYHLTNVRLLLFHQVSGKLIDINIHRDS